MIYRFLENQHIKIYDLSNHYTIKDSAWHKTPVKKGKLVNWRAYTQEAYSPIQLMYGCM